MGKRRSTGQGRLLDINNHVLPRREIFHEKMDVKSAAAYLSREMGFEVTEANVNVVFAKAQPPIIPLGKPRDFVDQDRVRRLAKYTVSLQDHVRDLQEAIRSLLPGLTLPSLPVPDGLTHLANAKGPGEQPATGGQRTLPGVVDGGNGAHK